MKVKTIFIIWIIVALSFLASTLNASAEQIYFVGKSAPLGSISKPESDKDAVYLRWDVTEGSIPLEVTSFVLKRDGVAIGDVMPAHSIMSHTLIENLYKEIGHKRRKLEIIRMLSEKQGLDAVDTVDSSNFVQVLYTTLLNDNYWSMLASRLDINVARARYRAYIDTDVKAGNTYSYELLALDNKKNEVRIGKVEVTVDKWIPVLKAENFEQVKGVARCDAPERFKEHSNVYLNWTHPGSNVPSAYANSLIISAYDLYRSVNEGGGDDARQLNDEKAVYDAEGRIEFNDLIKLNDVPIIISGKAEYENLNDGWNPPFSQFLQQKDELLALNMKAGETYTYYLVARDFTGNYGQTAYIDVTIPNLIAPPSPWSVHTITSVAKPKEEAFKLTWQQVNVANYYRAFKNDRVYCNLDSAKGEKILRFAPEDKTCSSKVSIEVMLDPEEYLVYRFDNIASAESFQDSDGDGFSNADEVRSIGIIGRYPLTDPEMACDAKRVPSGKTNYLVSRVPASSAVMVDGREVLYLNDPFMADQKGKVFWYRIATRGVNDQIGLLSPPIRGFFPDRHLPLRPQLGVDIVIGKDKCDYGIVTQDNYTMIFNDSTGEATQVGMDCDGSSVMANQDHLLEISGLGDARGVDLNIWNEKNCLAFQDQCNNIPSVTYYNENSEVISSSIPKYMSCSDKFDLQKICRSGEVEEIETEGLVRQVGDALVINILKSDGCIKIYREIGGIDYPLETLCELPTQYRIGFDGLEGEKLCLSFKALNDNAESSAILRAGCFVKNQNTPSAPNMMNLTFDEQKADIAWTIPAEPLSGTILEFFRKDSNNTFSEFVVMQESNSDITGGQHYNLELEPLTDVSEEWCVRARSVAKVKVNNDSKSVSEWSNTICTLRTETKELPTYLPWPNISESEKLSTLNAHYMEIEKIPVIVLSDAMNLNQNCGESTFSVPSCSDNYAICIHPLANIFPERIARASCTVNNFCSLVRQSAGDNINFVVYRQYASVNPKLGGDMTGKIDNFIQVSPLIDNFKCKHYSDGKSNFDYLAGPFISLIDMNRGVDFVGEHLIYQDFYPHETGGYYRYQLVFFNERGGIRGYKTTDWIYATEEEDYYEAY